MILVQRDAAATSPVDDVLSGWSALAAGGHASHAAWGPALPSHVLPQLEEAAGYAGWRPRGALGLVDLAKETAEPLAAEPSFLDEWLALQQSRAHNDESYNEYEDPFASDHLDRSYWSQQPSVWQLPANASRRERKLIAIISVLAVLAVGNAAALVYLVMQRGAGERTPAVEAEAAPVKTIEATPVKAIAPPEKNPTAAEARAPVTIPAPRPASEAPVVHSKSLERLLRRAEADTSLPGADEKPSLGAGVIAKPASVRGTPLPEAAPNPPPSGPRQAVATPAVAEPVPDIAHSETPRTEAPRTRRALKATLDRDDVLKTVRANMPALKSCFERDLVRSKRPLPGVMTLRWVITPSGGVEAPQVETAQLHGSFAERCVLASMRQWHFAPYRAGRIPVRFPVPM